MKHCICMISDFFYPKTGGVENHIYQLSQQLILRGHKVVVITHHYGNRVTIRYLSNYLKVYYLPFPCVYLEGTFPLLVCTLPLIRDIFIREGVTLAHAHGAYSGLGADGMLSGSIMDLPTVFTDHSLFGFADVSSILTNKLFEFFSSDIDHVICVSYTSKENTILRGKLSPSLVSVIPNAVDGHNFIPDPSKGNPHKMIVSRLVYRKGTDLLAAIIPKICQRHSDVDFLIGGDGPKRVLLEEVREKHCLQDRVTLSDGMIPHSNVRNFLVQGDIFLNTSITEAFCIAIVEAACCGLQVVSTNVGGVPEVLPSDLIHLAEPNVSALIECLEMAIKAHREGEVMCPQEKHERVRTLYTWANVAERTEEIYDRVTQRPHRSIAERLKRYYSRSPLVVGVVYVIAIVIVCLAHIIMEWWRPAHLIDRAVFKNIKNKHDK